MTKDNKFSFIRNPSIQASPSPKKERSSRRRQINPRKQRKPEAIAIYPEIYLHAPSNVEEDFPFSAVSSEPETSAALGSEPEVEDALTGQHPDIEQGQRQGAKFLSAKERSLQPQAISQAKGKRSNPDYEQVTAYIRRETYTAIKIALLQQGKTRGFSELVEELLTAHLQKTPNPLD